MRDWEEEDSNHNHQKHSKQQGQRFEEDDTVNSNELFDNVDNVFHDPFFSEDSRMRGSSPSHQNFNQHHHHHNHQQSTPHFQSDFTHSTATEKAALSLLSKRTLLVSMVLLVGFVGIFMWSWLFEMVGLFSGNSKHEQEKSQTQVSEVLMLPEPEAATTQLALVTSPVQTTHSQPPQTGPSSAPVPTTVPNSLPTVSKTANDIQGVSTGGTHVEPTHVHKVSEVPQTMNVNESNVNEQVIPSAEETLPLQTPQNPITNTTSEFSGIPAPASESASELASTPASAPVSTIAAEALQNKADPLTKTVKKQGTLLLNCQPSHYTIQILAIQDEQKLKAFMKKHATLQNKMSHYTILRDGKILHVVVYGDFETKQKADAAVLNLPLEIQKNKPWVRTLRDVQGAIRG